MFDADLSIVRSGTGEFEETAPRKILSPNHLILHTKDVKNFDTYHAGLRH